MPDLLSELGLGSIPVLCTVPILKFGRLLLYDTALLENMEYEDETKGSEKMNEFLEDVDNCFSKCTTVKYYQNISLSEIIPLNSKPEFEVIKFCAYPSGRTMGGTLWKVSYKQSEILYLQDFSLR